MKRALNVRDILSKKYETFPFEGKWREAFETPERTGVWFIWGASGNGKTSFVMQLCKELCKYDRVAFNSLEPHCAEQSETFRYVRGKPSFGFHQGGHSRFAGQAPSA